MEVYRLDDRYYLEIALEEAEEAFEEGAIPIGAVIAGPEGKILSAAANEFLLQWPLPAMPRLM